MMNTLFLGWQNIETRRWHPIGQLTKQGNLFRFVYIQGVQAAREDGFASVPEFPDWKGVYESERLFPTFANRVLPASRPDFAEYIAWLRLQGHEKDPLAFLARTEGKRQTDNLDVFSSAEQTDEGGWRVLFFVHALRHMSPEAEVRAQALQPGEPLLVQWDLQNPAHREALMLRTHFKPSGDTMNIGYCPRYLAHEVLTALTHDPKSVAVCVVNISERSAPPQYRILAELRFSALAQQPFSSEDFQPLPATFSV
jgi:hypothetical protein